MPVDKGRVTAKYRKPGAWAAGFHTGVDFGVPTGTPVKAVGPGTVVTAGWDNAYGNYVVLKMADGLFTLYAHMSQLGVGSGQAVGGGTQLGLSGATGNVTGPHLHFEARTANRYHGHTDPMAYLAGHGVARAKRSTARKTAAKKVTAKKATARKVAAKKAPAKRPATYTVKAGDTLSGIALAKLGAARRYLEIARLNGIANPDAISAGQRLKLPQG
ncbi:peptidoglycan DD-metalloendopeptidase family protein [Streptomyces sp. A7024]|uniref:Peptidoglycan DD-metalloendopeptidase family protein n=1 Tax=Streptomyces coryli TaxID=1128680 RepID=A0A6G4TVU3_9ACTN|nr:M23 family metallopeptidase [Streptomyces coryli]NGN63933.1 peptidoglycan DD-metalloendopeptidase family protein [Streptomyces coryli]